MKKRFRNIDFIFHQAALRSVPRSVGNPIETNKINIEGTLNVLWAAKENKVKRVIFASSSSVYGKQKKTLLEEGFCPNPISPYGLSKLAGEVYLKQFCDLYGLETISLRYFNVFGPYQDPENEYAAVIPIFVTKMLKNKTCVIDWDGKQSRDFTYIDNVVEANVLAMKVKKTYGEVVNVCDGKTVSINQLFTTINQILGKDLKAGSGPKRPGDMKITLGNPSKAKRVLNFKTKASFEEGLKKTIEWFQKH